MVFKIQNIRSGVSGYFKNNFCIIIAAAFILLFAQGIFNLFWMKHSGKTAYIDTEKVYNDFALKKKLEGDMKETQLTRQNILDSLKLQLDMMYPHLTTQDTSAAGAFTILRDNYFAKQEEFKEQNDALAQQYTSQIWSQLNQYLQDYGQKGDYQYIFGANGDGSLMFANDAVNITDDVKTYVNNRYNGKP